MEEWEATGMTRPKWDGSANMARHIEANLDGTVNKTEPAWKGAGTASHETWRLRSHQRNETQKRTRYAHFKTKQFQEWDKDREWNEDRSTHNHRQNIAGEYITTQRKPIGQKGFASAVSALTVNIKMKSLANKAKGRLAAKLKGGSGDLPNLSSIMESKISCCSNDRLQDGHGSAFSHLSRQFGAGEPLHSGGQGQGLLCRQGPRTELLKLNWLPNGSIGSS